MARNGEGVTVMSGLIFYISLFPPFAICFVRSARSKAFGGVSKSRSSSSFSSSASFIVRQCPRRRRRCRRRSFTPYETPLCLFFWGLTASTCVVLVFCLSGFWEGGKVFLFLGDQLQLQLRCQLSLLYIT